MSGWNWNEFLVAGLLAVCILGPICVVLLTQNLLDSYNDIGAEHYDFDCIMETLGETQPPLEKNER